ncbi:hypothetical protein C0Q70_00789 [Pomacea canaliculata]|uniref:NADP-dependent oxidoreductase domain-containing protein n=2 Tax=Pomacea canaliculata TaxID=400727 RepID=A0A2T7PXP7_POMCA|nr:uncharacterized protein LOC112574279 isoform X2 [Pomacea canaliculata]XP_025111060.1 uncharacterized protein LOC112574279 isoform X2 [Pomacea canaliculata]PVD38178.1 hypothetical protein C0Q70_00789 [Pomacea canaliculata]
MVTVATSFSSTIKLNNGMEMPLFGLGVFRSEAGQSGPAERAVACALQNGYRMVDTATIYGNQADVGAGIKKSGIKREEVFIVTKLWKNGYETCRDELNNSLEQLDCDYVDLYLIHSPSNGPVLEAYKAMVEFQQKGLIRSIGVSNFGIHHLEEIRKAGMPTPAVNQIELNPWMRRSDLVQYCKDHGIAVMGYSPLYRGGKTSDAIVTEMAKSLNKTVGQLLIRYSVQKGYITIPKSTNPKHIVENADVFDWVIPEELMKKLESFPEKPSGWDPVVSPWKG